MLPSFCTDTITRERAPFKVERGAKMRDWSGDIDALSIGLCSVQDASTGRNFGRAENTTTVKRLYAPPNADIQAGDRITHEGVRYEIDGDPAPWKSPTGRVSSLQANLAYWRG
jgi:hypothetical protein